MNCLRSSIRTFFHYLHEAGDLASNPARLTRRARCGPPLPRTLTSNDERRLLEALSFADDPEARRDHALFHLMLATGLRVGSAVMLGKDDIDLERGEIILQNMKGGICGRKLVRNTAARI